MKFGVLVAKTSLYLLTKFRFPEITHLDMTLHVVTSCDVTRKGLVRAA